jgi:hypothetical protein
MAEFFKSFKVFFLTSIKTVYGWISFIFGLLSLVLPFINIPLPTKYQGCDMSIILMIIAWLFVFIAALKVFHDERMKWVHDYNELKNKRINEIYSFIPEALKGKVFKDLYELYREGEFLKEASEERRKKWDVMSFLGKYFQNICKNNYLMATGRVFAPPRIIPINDSRYNDAVSYIKDLLDNGFHTYFKV